MARRYFALDLKPDPALIAEYERWHTPQAIWPEVTADLTAAGVKELEIFRCGNRLVMMMEVPDDLATDPAERAGGRSAQWEKLMWRFQQPLPFAKAGEKWVPMKRIFSLSEASRGERR
jgi:L-rhamnose mutarotase